MKSLEAREAMLQPNYFGAMMLAMHQADGFVAGASQITASVLRPLFQIIKPAPHTTTVSSCMVMEVEDSRFGENGVMFMADCGVIPDPTVEQLADIAVSTAQLARHLLGVRPRVAMLSFSTKGSADPSIGGQSPSRHRPGRAEGAGKRSWRRISMANCRWTPRWSPKSPPAKLPDSKLWRQRQRADLPGPELRQHRQQAVRHVARANAYGQILLGLDRPAADVSRGSTAHDILGVAAIVGVQAIDYQLLYPRRGQETAGRMSTISNYNTKNHETLPMPLPYPTNPTFAGRAGLSARPAHRRSRPRTGPARRRHHQAGLERESARPVAPGLGGHAQGAGRR